MYLNIWLAKPTWELSRDQNNDYPSCEQWDTLSKHMSFALHVRIPLQISQSSGCFQCPLGTAWFAEVLTEWKEILAKDVTRSRPSKKEMKIPKLSKRTSTMSMSVTVCSKNKPWWFKHRGYLLLTHALSFKSLFISSGGRNFSYPEV